MARKERKPGKGDLASRDMADRSRPSSLPTDEELEQELSSIYGEEVGDDPNMKRLEKASGFLMRKVLVGLIVFFAFLAAVSWAGFFLFSPADDSFSGEGVSVRIEGPKTVRGGEPTTYSVFYENGEHVPLGTASLEVRLPDGFHVLEAEPSGENNTWQVGSLGPGKRGEVAITGVFLAPVGKELDMQAILTYKPADFNSDFQKVATESVSIEDSVIETEIEGPPKVLPGDTVTFSIGLKNTAAYDFSNILLELEYPDTFIAESSEPASVDESLASWVIPVLEGEGEQSVSVTGTFASEAKGRIVMKTRMGFLDEDDEMMLQRETEFSSDVLEGDLVTSLILNGKNESQAVRFGDTLRYTVSYRNTGSVSLEDVTIAVTLEPNPGNAALLLWNTLEDDAFGVRDGNVVSWGARQLDELERVGPDDEGTINFEIPLLEAPLTDVTEVDYGITSWVETRIGSIDGAKTDRMTRTQPIEARIASDASLAVEARFFNTDGIPIGTGPLPPVAGQTTTYRVTWNLKNTFHDLADLRMSTKLPPNSRWTGVSTVDAGEIEFDAAAEKMIWTLNWLPTTVQELIVSFDVELTPAEEQVGKIPTLIDATILEALDKVTGSSILLSAPPLTTALENDEFAAAKSRVQGGSN